MVRDSMSVLITNRKSHMGFTLVSESVTLNDLVRCNSLSPILRYFTEFDRFGGLLRYSSNGCIFLVIFGQN